MMPASDHERAILAALDLPEEAVPLLLAHVEKFCTDHGGEKHYAELMALIGKYQATLAER